MNAEDHGPAGLESRRRRAAYRATHRGTREMDWLLGRFAGARLQTMKDDELTLFERLLTIADPELQAWILRPEIVTGSEFAGLIGELRRFHDLDRPAKHDVGRE